MAEKIIAVVVFVTMLGLVCRDACAHLPVQIVDGLNGSWMRECPQELFVTHLEQGVVVAVCYAKDTGD